MWMRSWTSWRPWSSKRWTDASASPKPRPRVGETEASSRLPAPPHPGFRDRPLRPGAVVYDHRGAWRTGRRLVTEEDRELAGVEQVADPSDLDGRRGRAQYVRRGVIRILPERMKHLEGFAGGIVLDDAHDEVPARTVEGVDAPGSKGTGQGPRRNRRSELLPGQLRHPGQFGRVRRECEGEALPVLLSGERGSAR